MRPFERCDATQKTDYGVQREAARNRSLSSDIVIERRACRDEGSFICETDLREVQGYQEKRQDHDHLREPEAQTETGLIRSRLL